jgi:DNA replication protein DnaC
MPFAKLSGALLGYPAAIKPAESEARANRTSASAPPPRERVELLAGHLRALKLPAFLAEHEDLAQRCATAGLGHSEFLLRLAEREVAERHRRRVERLIKGARFPALKNLESFDFAALSAVDKALVLELADCAYVALRTNVILVGSSGTGKSHIALGLGLAACHKGLSVGFFTAAALVQELIEARAHHRLRRLQRSLAAYKLLIIDELGYTPFPEVGAELLFEVVSERCERGSTVVTSNLPIGEWIGVFGNEQLTGALVDRLAHRGQTIQMTGESYRAARAAGHQPAIRLAGGRDVRGTPGRP